MWMLPTAGAIRISSILSNYIWYKMEGLALPIVMIVFIVSILFPFLSNLGALWLLDWFMEVYLQQVLQSQMSPAIQVKILKPSSSSSPVKVDTKQTPKKTSEDVVEPSSKTPNQLAEELVRCMAAIYCKLANPPLPKFSSLSPSSSSSSTTTHESSHEFSNLHGSWSPGSQTDNTSSEMDGCIMPDPYSVKDVGGEDVGPYCSMVEVPWICVDKDRLTYATQALHNFR